MMFCRSSTAALNCIVSCIDGENLRCSSRCISNSQEGWVGQETGVRENRHCKDMYTIYIYFLRSASIMYQSIGARSGHGVGRMRLGSISKSTSVRTSNSVHSAFQVSTSGAQRYVRTWWTRLIFGTFVFISLYLSVHLRSLTNPRYSELFLLLGDMSLSRNII